MTMPEVVMTIGKPYCEEDICNRVDTLMQYGVINLRFNLSKCNDENLVEVERVITRIKADYGNVLKFMLDVPYPRKKARIVLPRGRLSSTFRRGQLVRIGSQNMSQSGCQLYVDVPDIIQRVSIGEDLIYSDGECILRLEAIDASGIVSARCSNDVQVFSMKSLSLSSSIPSSLSRFIIDMIKEIEPQSVAFSFVQNAEDAHNCRRIVNNDKIETISKIESEAAMSHVEEICGYSNIMFGRGDFQLHSSIGSLVFCQREIIERVKNCGRKIYIATGILASMHHQSLPSPADVSDLYLIMKDQPDAIVLNSDLITQGNFRYAHSLMESVFHRIYQ